VLPLATAVWQFLEPIRGYELLERAVMATRGVQSGLRSMHILLLGATSQYALWRGDAARAATRIDECVGQIRETDQEPEVALALLSMSYTASGLGDIDRAESFALNALGRWQALGMRQWAGETLNLLGSLVRMGGEFDRSEALLLEALEIVRSEGPDQAVAAVLMGLGECAVHRREYARAAAMVLESLPIYLRTGKDPTMLIYCLLTLAKTAAEAGRAEEAARLFGAIDAIRERYGIEQVPNDRIVEEQLIATARARLSEDAFASAWQAGRAQPLDTSFSEALALAEDIAASAPRRRGADELTPRERDVLRLLVEGRSNRAIAEALHLSERTIENHILHILTKLNVESRTAAATYAIRHGLA